MSTPDAQARKSETLPPDTVSSTEVDPAAASRKEPEDPQVQPVVRPLPDEGRHGGHAPAGWEEAYERLLGRFWAAANRDAADNARANAEKPLYLKAMMRLAVPRASGPEITATEEIPGTADDVQLVASRRVAGLDPSAVPGFLRTTLAPSVERLELRREATPEKLTDIVIRVLQPLIDTDDSVELGIELLRFIQVQPPDDRSVGYFDTIDDVANVIARGRADESQRAAAFASHLVLSGLRALCLADPTVIDGRTKPIVSNSAFRIATIMARALNTGRREAPSTERAREVFRDLQTVSVITTPTLAVPEEAADEATFLLGFPPGDAVELFSVLDDMGAVGEAWQRTWSGQAQVVAYSAIAAALGGRTSSAPSRLYNAGVSLALQDSATAGQEQHTRARMLCNALGLRMALIYGDDLYTALIEYSGLSCAVNLVGSFAQYRDMPDVAPDVRDTFRDVAQDLVNLSSWAPLQVVDPELDVSVARLASASTVLRLPTDPDADLTLLPGHLDAAVEAARASMLQERSSDDVVLDTAELLRMIFERLVVPDEEEPIGNIVAGLISDRSEPARVFVERYAPYVSTDGGVGPGPLVAAGLVPPADWDATVSRVTRPRQTISQALRDYGT